MQVSVTAYDLGRIRIASTRVDGAMADDQLKTSLDEYREMLESFERDKRQVISFIDMTGMGTLSAQQRRIQSDWNRSIQPIQKAVTLGLAFIAPGTVTRGMLTAVFWFSPPAAPYIICSKMSEALAWAFAMCRENGVGVNDTAMKECRECFGPDADADGGGGGAKRAAGQRA
jgi:hypothetical protein